MYEYLVAGGGDTRVLVSGNSDCGIGEVKHVKTVR